VREPKVFPRASIHSQLRVPELTKLYVGNLPFAATEDAVRSAFAPHGIIESLLLMTDRTTGPPQRFGFIEMANADAARAMQALNGTDFGGRLLKINEAPGARRA
jgi:RNA recognition motif-containing protein